MNDNPIDIIAWADQNSEGYKQIARLHAAHYESLRELGIPEHIAIQMTRALIVALHSTTPRRIQEEG